MGLRRQLNRQGIRAKILQDPYYRLQSLEEVAIASELGAVIDVNQATVDDWLRLPVISIHQARNLVELREMGLQFFALEDVAAALNIPSGKLKPFEPILSFCFYEADHLLTQKVNPNFASQEQLKQIPELDDSLVQIILENRQQQGNYRNLADFQRRLSLNPSLLSQLMHYLQF